MMESEILTINNVLFFTDREWNILFSTMFPNFTKSLKEAEGCISQLNIVNCGRRHTSKNFVKCWWNIFKNQAAALAFKANSYRWLKGQAAKTGLLDV